MDLVFAVLIFAGTPAVLLATLWYVYERLAPKLGNSLTGILAAVLFVFGPLIANTPLAHVFEVFPILAIWSAALWVGVGAGGLMAFGKDWFPEPLLPQPRPTAHAHGDLWHEHAHEGLHYHPNGEHDTTHILIKEGN